VRALVVLCVVLAAPRVFAQEAPRPIVGFEVRGHSKLTNKTAEYLSHYDLGDPITAEDIPKLEQAFQSSELFESVDVTLEPAPGGVRVVVTLDDKHSWIAAPTLFVLPGNRAFGVGFAENNFQGKNQKILLYGQLGTRESLFFGTFLNPSLDGTPINYRLDLYAYRRGLTEYANPMTDDRDSSIARITTATYLGGGALIGYRLGWWINVDLRLRYGHVTFRGTHADDAAQTPLPIPETDGWDVSMQSHLTVDARHHRYGVTWGPFAQVIVDHTIPGMDDYDYSSALFRAYYSWHFWGEHQFEIRTGGGIGKHLPLQEDLALGSAPDLRGYAVDRFRGDVRLFGRLEYSLPLFKWRSFALRSIGFWDTGTIGFHSPRTGGDRIYLPSQAAGIDRWRNDVGAGLRVYVKSIVLPLLGLDVGYGIEAHSPVVYFEVGITDF
jgi:outer membrane protein insertion porin family